MSRLASPALIAALCKAADYRDGFFESEDGESRFFAYFVCLAGNPPCDTFILAKEWRKKFTIKDELDNTCGVIDSEWDGWVKGQSWYCHCDGKYKCRYGMMCEFKFPWMSKPVYARAEFPTQPFLDAKCMMAEAKFPDNLETAKELYDAIGNLGPLKNEEVLEEMSTHPGHYKFKQTTIGDLPLMDWNQIFNLIGQEQPAARILRFRSSVLLIS